MISSGDKKNFRKIDNFFREDVVTSGGGLCFVCRRLKFLQNDNDFIQRGGLNILSCGVIEFFSRGVMCFPGV